jgi:hypothetical protein
MTKFKLLALALFVGIPFYGSAQKDGYFGKKNMFSLHGNWFFRSVPQVFYQEEIYSYREPSDEFVSGFFRNHIGTVGLSFKRLVSERTAFGLQVDLGMRNLGSPRFDLSSKSTFLSVWSNELNQNAVWSEGHEKFFKLTDLELSKTKIINRQLLVTWSRTKTTTVMPLGLMSTFGLGVQYASIRGNQNIYAKAYSKDQLDSSWSTDKTIFRTDAPSTLKNDYLGIVWMWDLSLNYAVSRNLIFSLGSDIRGVAHVFSLSKDADFTNAFPLSQQGVPTIEALAYGRNFKKEIRKEMLFQNTFRAGLILMF